MLTKTNFKNLYYIWNLVIILAKSFFSTLLILGQTRCPGNFHRLATGCYNYLESELNWKEAKGTCLGWGARMVVVEDEIERKEITRWTQDLIDKKVRFWLDGKKTSNGWRLFDKGVVPKYSPWGPIPTDIKGNCLRTGPETKWYSASCSSKTLPGGYKMSALCVMHY